MLYNRKLLKDVRYAGVRYITIHCNARSSQCTREATLPGFGVVWFNEGGIANILSFSKFNKYYDLQYYHDDDVFAVLKPTHRVISQ